MPTDRTTVCKTDCTDPYRNLASEEYLLGQVGEDECILYLWRNADTVVIGRNQNCYIECRPANIRRDGIHLARRLSGGGAVWHDLGNLNFTFVTPRSLYDPAAGKKIVLDAVRSFGIDACFSGRNDLLAGGRKFSGSASYLGGSSAYWHGCVLVDADLTRLGEYLNVPGDKLRAKGISSVSSRVTDLSALRDDITTAALSAAMERSFADFYGLEPRRTELPQDDALLNELTEKYSSDEWIYGDAPDADYRVSGRFAWGGITFLFSLDNGIVKKCSVDSDALDASLTAKLAPALTGRHFEAAALKAALMALGGGQQILDCCSLLDI